MKKVITLLLAAGLVIGAASAANAVDIKAKGLWHNAMSFADRNFEKHNGSDKMQNATRIRTQIDVIASESLKGVVYFEIGPQNWGKGADGASLGTDGKVVKVRYNYIDWVIPQTDAKVRMGLQNFSLPGFALPNVILGGGGADGAGITLPPSSPRTSEPPSSGCAPKTTTPTAPPTMASNTTTATPWTSRASPCPSSSTA